MDQKNYRFNRKDGNIYLEVGKELQNIGSSLQIIVLSSTKPSWEQPFPNTPFQYWVRLIFLNNNGDLCNALLNNGTTNALTNWMNYVAQVRMKYELYEMITTISLVESDGDYFDYSFAGISGKPGLGDRMKKLISSLALN
ncbi:hypothetical protein VB711_19105 [Cronbergia sp. UHCC 0137]|uniref:hypothetical protein n=1 Tax=Cronbergia sp. UHCC 0137 TaxID=3110239 RepID=UPI002B1EBE9D|nr:hypothetical protein [Cronbergia sp. UHCC 0137]MEA5619937.1 hypothetical protein [Cronbergia sp. UHCC 0137]